LRQVKACIPLAAEPKKSKWGGIGKDVATRVRSSRIQAKNMVSFFF